jgi:hypothetical protein
MTACRRCGVLITTVVVVGAMFLACGGGDREVRSTVPPVAADGLVIIDYADSADSFVTRGADSVTVLDRLQTACTSHGIGLSTTDFPYGTLIQGIGHRRNGEGGYWLYRVNGAMIPRAADRYRVAPADTIRFFFD